MKICEIWEPIEAERNDAVLYASNVPLVFLCAKGVVGRCVCVCVQQRKSREQEEAAVFLLDIKDQILSRVYRGLPSES